MSSHLPMRPAWVCSGCGGDWPCHTKRLQLRAEFLGAPVSLALYLSACFIEAAHSNPQARVGELYTRFLGWVGPQ